MRNRCVAVFKCSVKNNIKKQKKCKYYNKYSKELGGIATVKDTCHHLHGGYVCTSLSAQTNIEEVDFSARGQRVQKSGACGEAGYWHSQCSGQNG